MGERLLCKQEVAGSIPAGSIPEVPASVHISREATFGGDKPCSALIPCECRPTREGELRAGFGPRPPDRPTQYVGPARDTRVGCA